MLKFMPVKTLSNLKANAQTYEPDLDIYCLIILVLIVLLGEIITFAMIGSRKWHAEYMNCSIILQKFYWSNSGPIDANYLPVENREPFFGNLSTSRSFLITQLGILSLVIFSARHLMGLWITGTLAKGSPFQLYPILLVIGVFIWILNKKIAAAMLKRSEDRFWKNPCKNWCLSGLRYQDELQKEKVR
jgi:hypothetical protein